MPVHRVKRRLVTFSCGDALVPKPTSDKQGFVKKTNKTSVLKYWNQLHISDSKCNSKTFYCNDIAITDFEMIDAKIFSTTYVVTYELITYWVWD